MEKKKNYILPVSILIAAVLISGAVLYSAGDKSSDPAAGSAATGSVSPENLLPIQPEDHVRGSSDADLVFFEYSDFECPYCQAFQTTMKRVFDEYGSSGKVAWVYRHFPVHQKAQQEAVATECAAKLGGNDAFWEYSDLLFERSALNDQTDLSILPEIAGEIGLDTSAFESCLSSGEFDEKITQDRTNAVATGGEGTPWTVVLVQKTGEKFVVSGAQPYAAIQDAIDFILNKAENQE